MGLNLFDSMGNAVPTGEVIKRLTEWYDCEHASAENGVYAETMGLIKTILTKDFSPKEVYDLFTDREVTGALDAEDSGHIANAILQHPLAVRAFCWDVKPGDMEEIMYEYFFIQLINKDMGAIMQIKEVVDAAVAKAVTERMKE